MLTKLIHWVIMPCQDASLVLEQQMGGGKSTWRQQLRLRMHLMVCKWCNAYHKKGLYIDQVMKKIVFKEPEALFKEMEIQSFKVKIKEQLKK